MEKINLTAIIIAKNEAGRIGNAISSTSFCNEIIVADDASNDDTSKISKESGARVVTLPSGMSFSEKRTFALSKATNDWVLFIDADEEITPRLQKAIATLWESDKKADAYFLKRRDFWWGKELRFGETYRVRNTGICRLFNKRKGKWVGSVHEVWLTEGQTATLSGYLNHYPHENLRHFIDDINIYSSMRAEELLRADVPVSLSQIVFLPIGKFVLTYIIYLGFLDGPAGFAYSFLMSFHSFLVRAKLYQHRKLDTSL